MKTKLVILGGGTAGWMTASALSVVLDPSKYLIELVESSAISTVGVGEATLPHIRQFNQLLGIDENEFMMATGATYKLGIEFVGWGSENSAYIHPFGGCGADLDGVDFHHYWLHLQEEGNVEAFDKYSIAAEMARQAKFRYPSSDFNSIESDFGYAFHLDATLYAQFLKKISLARGVVHTEGKVIGSKLCDASGKVQGLQLEGGAVVEGDFFVDCSGGRGELIAKALGVEFEDWSHWLPCNRAWVAPTENASELVIPPFTRSTAKEAGWQWKIPLQHRAGNGYVFSCDFVSEDSAQIDFVEGLDRSPEVAPRLLNFQTGKRKASWEKNVVAIGLSAGFLEPLESTSIYLIQLGIQKLIQYFPIGNDSLVEREAFNRDLDLEYERIRDFLILHYQANSRDDSEFWRHCREMKLPASLEEKIEIFLHTARVVSYRKGLFMPASWLAVYLGQGVRPFSYDSRVKRADRDKLALAFANLNKQVVETVKSMASHTDALIKTKQGKGDYSAPVFSLYGARKS